MGQSGPEGVLVGKSPTLPQIRSDQEIQYCHGFIYRPHQSRLSMTARGHDGYICNNHPMTIPKAGILNDTRENSQKYVFLLYIS